MGGLSFYDISMIGSRVCFVSFKFEPAPTLVRKHKHGTRRRWRWADDADGAAAAEASRVTASPLPPSQSMAFSSAHTLLSISAVLRLVLIIYGEWQDKHMAVRYTDVDYLVFSDAASLVATGKSPFARSTYRYSPLLAFLLLPNYLLHPAWGKLIFSASDLLVGLFMHRILRKRLVPENLSLCCMAAWLFNPFTFTIGTRGNCEPIVCAIILWIIISLMNGNILQSAFWFGLVVHFRIYPIIYALPILLVLEPHVFVSSYKPTISEWGLKYNGIHNGLEMKTMNPYVFFKSLMTRERILFGLISASVFFSLTAFFFFLYGWEFLNEALLYHLTRTDPRHNFSIYFYHIYLCHGQLLSILQKIISFLPQWMVQLVLVSSFAQDLPFCFFAQTVAFVAFNKVITAQYFVWFFCLLPLILPWCKMKIKWKGIFCIILWMGAQIHWLMWGYLLEFKGKNVFVQLWLASIIFLAANTCVLVIVMRNYRFCPTFARLERVDSDYLHKIE